MVLETRAGFGQLCAFKRFAAVVLRRVQSRDDLLDQPVVGSMTTFVGFLTEGETGC
jgi:hypothetical protein